MWQYKAIIKQMIIVYMNNKINNNKIVKIDNNKIVNKVIHKQ